MREEAWKEMNEDKKRRVNKFLFFSHQPSAIVSLWEKRRVLIYKCLSLKSGSSVISYGAKQ